MNITPRRGVRRAGRNAHPAVTGTLPSTVLTDPTPLIGRERELEAICKQLLSESVRLVTLTGAGGIGKTRLALAAARCVEAAFPDGAWFVDLAPLRDPAELDAAIAHILKLDEGGRQPLAERVTADLGARTLLLVLDNFEHLLPAAVRVRELLAAAPRLKILVTSREPLKLRLEQRVAVAPLALPDLRAADPATVVQASAVALFVEHARRLRPNFALTPADAPALAALLHRLDGIPLAIQIAAAQSHVLSPAAMLARLGGQALLSTEEAQDVSVRHYTLRRAIDWSHGLLTAAEQAAFRQLGVFVGGWTLAAAEAVLQESEPASPVWAILGRLVDKSLVQAEAFREGLRYRMLEPIREYAVDRLGQSAELDAVRDRHARYFATLAEQLEAASFGPQESTLFREAAAEHENFRAAVRWAIERRDGELSLRLAGSLMPFWVWRDSLREGQRCLEEARTVGSEARPLLRAKALAAEGGLAWLLGEYPKARTLLQEALPLAEAIHDPALTARVLWRLGFVLALQGHASEARALLERSAALGREAEDPGAMALALAALGLCYVLLDDLERAEADLNSGLDLARQNGSPRVIWFPLTGLAHLKLRREDYAGAATLAAEALKVAQAWESRRGIKAAVAIAALVAGHRGEVEHAVRLLAAVDPWSNWGEVVTPYHDAAAMAELHARARKQIGDEAYRAAVADAQAMSVEQVADLAQAYLEPSTARSRDRSAASGAAAPRTLLSDRERTILRLIGEGLPNKQIATALSIAERTVRAHLTSAMNKLGADNRAHAVVTAIQRGLL